MIITEERAEQIHILVCDIVGNSHTMFDPISWHLRDVLRQWLVDVADDELQRLKDKENAG